MAKFDRYMLSQLLVLFGFFSLVLVAVFWINRAVVLFDRLIGDGQTALVFLEFSALGMPKLISTVLPLSTFAAAVYVTNRLNNESELTVVQAAGSGPFRLARPILVFGIISALMMSILANILVPAAQAQLSERESEITQNVTARLLTEGVFLHPASGVTFYTGSIAPDGVLQDVFMADRRNPEERVLYTSDEAYLVQNGDGTSLIMVDGLVPTPDRAGLTPDNHQISGLFFRYLDAGQQKYRIVCINSQHEFIRAFGELERYNRTDRCSHWLHHRGTTLAFCAVFVLYRCRDDRVCDPFAWNIFSFWSLARDSCGFCNFNFP